MCILVHLGGPFFSQFPLGLCRIRSILERRSAKKNKMSPHKVQIKFCCVASFFLPPPPFSIGCFHNRTKCVRGVSQEQSGERESPKQHVKVTSLNQVSAALCASRLDSYEPYFPSGWAVFLLGFLLLLAKCSVHCRHFQVTF